MNLEQKNGVPTTQETRALVRNSDKHRAGGGLLRFIRFEMDHRRNTTHRGRSSLGIYGE